MHLIKTSMRDPVDNWIMHTSICLSRMVLRSMVDFFFRVPVFQKQATLAWQAAHLSSLFFSFFFVVISDFSLLSLHVAIYPVAALYVYKIELNDLNAII